MSKWCAWLSGGSAIDWFRIGCRPLLSGTSVPTASFRLPGTLGFSEPCELLKKEP